MKISKAERFHTSVNPDALSDVLQWMGIQGQLFCYAILSAPWAFHTAADQMPHFHYIERGKCHLKKKGQSQIQTLRAGDLIILPHGNHYNFFDGSEGEIMSIESMVKNSPKGKGCAMVEFGGEGRQTRMICGTFQFRPGRKEQILPLLPDFMLLDSGESSKECQILLDSILMFISLEAREQLPGASLSLSRLVEILFVQVLRAWLNTQDLSRMQNWLSALKDERISEALNIIHARPEHAWTVASLAEQIHMSRSPFAARFKKVVGEPPLTYLTKWRMRLASDLLQNDRLGLSDIAVRVGYESQTSFSKAFKSVMGMPPGEYRKMAKPRAEQKHKKHARC